jgi:hypothetical protein
VSWDDTAAVVAAIKTVPAVASKTFISITPGGTVQPLPYVIVHPADGVDEQTRFTGPYATTHPEFTLHIVGGSAEQASALTALVKAKFTTGGVFIIPTVSGRVGKNGYWRSPLPIQIDNDVAPALTYQVIQLGWTSDPA